MLIAQHILPSLRHLDDSVFEAVRETVLAFDTTVLPHTLPFFRGSPRQAKASLDACAAHGAGGLAVSWLRYKLFGAGGAAQEGGQPAEASLAPLLMQHAFAMAGTAAAGLPSASTDELLGYLLLGDQEPGAQTVWDLAKQVPATGPAAETLVQVVRRFGLVGRLTDLAIADCPAIGAFAELRAWLRVLASLEPGRIRVLLEPFLGHPDRFWSELTVWVASDSLPFDHVSPAMIERISALDRIPAAFLLRLSAANGDVTEFGSLRSAEKSLGRTWHAREKQTLLASLLLTALGCDKPHRLAAAHCIIASLPAPDRIDDILEPAAARLIQLVHNAGIQSPASLFEVADFAAGPEIAEAAAWLRALSLQPDAAHAPEASAGLMQLLVLLEPGPLQARVADKAALAGMFRAHPAASVADLIRAVVAGTRTTAEALKLLQAFPLGQLAEPQAIKAGLLSFCYQASQRLCLLSPRSALQLADLKTIYIHFHVFADAVIRLVGKLVGFCIEACEVRRRAAFDPQQCAEVVDILSALIATNALAESDVVSLAVLRFFLGQAPAGPPGGSQAPALQGFESLLSRDLPTAHDVRLLGSADISLAADLVLFKMEGHLRSWTRPLLQDSVLEPLSLLLKGLFAGTADAAVRLGLKKCQLLLGTAAGDAVSRAPLAAPSAEEYCCFSPIYRIKFAIIHLRRLAALIVTEKDPELQSAFAFTIQSTCRFLGLHVPTCDVWDAFDEQEKKVLGQYLYTKYRFDADFATAGAPVALKTRHVSEWAWALYCQLLDFAQHDPEAVHFLKLFSATISLHTAYAFQLLASFVLMLLLRTESFAAFLLQEFAVVADAACVEIKRHHLILYDQLYWVFVRILDASVDVSQDEAARLRGFFKVLPHSVLSSLALSISDNPRALKFAELDYAQGSAAPNNPAQDTSVPGPLAQSYAQGSAASLQDPVDHIQNIQRLYYANGLVDNGDGLSDFFSPSDARQQAYLMKASGKLACAADILKKTRMPVFDVTELLKSLEDDCEYGSALELLLSPSQRLPELCTALKGLEESACFALSKWEIFDGQHEKFSPRSAPDASSWSELARWLDNDAHPISSALLLDPAFPDLCRLKLSPAPALAAAWTATDERPDWKTVRKAAIMRSSMLDLSGKKTPELTDALTLQLAKALLHLQMPSKAHSELLKLPGSLRSQNVLVEASILHAMGFEPQAIGVLDYALRDPAAQDGHTMHLKLASIKKTSGHYAEKEIAKHFELASRLSNDPEIYFAYAKYLDRDFGILSLQDDEQVLKAAYHALKNYVRTLMFSSRHDVEVVPRFLTIWLDMAANARRGVWPEKVNHLVSKTIRSIQPTQFFRALPQLVSRIMHQNRSTIELIQSVVVSVFSKFPHQTLWSLLAVLKSCLAHRQKRAIDLVLKFRKDPAHGHLCKEYSSFADLIIGLANFKTLDGIKVLSASKDFPSLRKAVPCQVQVPAALHRPTATPVMINMILDRIDVIFSMQKPKKVSFKGNDGQLYHFLCKPNDDLRKDYRMIELVDLANGLFSKSHSHLRNYLSTSPFHPQCSHP